MYELPIHQSTITLMLEISSKGTRAGIVLPSNNDNSERNKLTTPNLVCYYASRVHQVSPAPGSIFVDLGSGAGKALFSAALGLPPGTFSECRGVEILPGLAQQSRAALSRYSTFAESRGLPPVVIECENMFYSNVWMDADLVYCFATVLGPESQMLLQQRIEDMKSGSRALIVSKRLTSPLLKETEIFELQMSHNGESLPCFLYERL